MLEHSFVLLDGIGPRREDTIWRAGVMDWDEFMRRKSIPRISPARKRSMDDRLEQARDRLSEGDSGYFARCLPPREHWRCLDEFDSSTIYLDIETTGVSRRDDITVVGIFDGTRTHALIRGVNLDHTSLDSILSKASTIVTFNGAGFDLPMIETHFPGVIPAVPHIDLRHLLRRLGHCGGLKAIERELGIERDRRVEYMTGEDAVYLWRAWRRKGNRNALDLLLEYNSEDCENLGKLSRYAYKKMRRGFERAMVAAKD
ncbi:MAG TPA: ribonuclease H-like domain-containing protein [Thermoplasmata archaeon]|jgi:uncharacterized protein YprB with RNaseH-like and TPR domain|nr:ribonuclease H-like domain-containing protein [Thermoplasmata archaeon]